MTPDWLRAAYALANETPVWDALHFEAWEREFDDE